MAPTDNQKGCRDAFEALPRGNKAPGMDTRIRALAHEQAKSEPRRATRPIMLTGSLATAVLAIILARPLWHSAPDPLRATEPANQERLEQAATILESEAAVEEVVVFSQPASSVAAVADTRGSTFSAERALSGADTQRISPSAPSTIDSQVAMQTLAKAAALPEISVRGNATEQPISEDTVETTESDKELPGNPAPEREIVADESYIDTTKLNRFNHSGPMVDPVESVTPVQPALWWQQIVKLIDYGHIKKARTEYRLLIAEHPNFVPPAGSPEKALAELGLPAEE